MDMFETHMQAFPSLIFLRLVVLLLQQLSLPPIVCILKLSLPYHFEFNALLHHLTLTGNQIKGPLFAETIVPPFLVGRRHSMLI